LRYGHGPAYRIRGRDLVKPGAAILAVHIRGASQIRDKMSP